MARNRRIRFVSELFIYRLLTLVISLLPRRTALALGAFLGRLAPFILIGRKRLAEANMRLALRELDNHQVRQEVRKMFIHLGIVGMELLMLKRFHAEPDLSRFFEFHHPEFLEQAYKRGRGVLLLTAHLGFWEAGTFFLPKLGYPTAFIAKKMKNPRMDSYLTQIREMSGGEIIDAKRGARRILKALNEGKVVCVLPDQDNRDGEPVDFFGRPARTTTMVAQLANKTGAAVVPGFTYRSPDNRYHNYFDEPLKLCGGNTPETILENTRMVNEVIERAIRREPSQWFWLHHRWRL